MLDLDHQNRLREQYRLLNPQWRPATETYAALVDSHLDPSSRVLDIGCGRGGIVEQLDHPAAQFTGLDPDWLSLSEHRLDSINRVAADSDHLPFMPESFDLVLASWVLEHLSDPHSTFHQIMRILKPGGVFIFITPNGLHPAAILNRLMGHTAGLQGGIVKGLYGREQEDTFLTYYRANTADQLEVLASNAGFELTLLSAIPDPTYFAFTDSLFPLACWFEDVLPPSRHIHLVGVLRRAE